MSVSITAQLQKEVSRLALRNWHYLLLAGGLALVLSLLASSHWQSVASLGALDEIEMSRNRVDRIDAMLVAVLDAETGVRGYLATSSKAYLQPYRGALPRIAGSLATLHADADAGVLSKDRVERLQTVVDRKLELLARSVETRAIEMEAGERIGEDKRLMDEIRLLLASLETEAWTKGQAQIAASKDAISLARWAIFGLGLGALVLLVASFGLVVRQIRLRSRIRDLLAGENQRLESEVARRTAELSRMAQYLSNVRETEKSRLARELHDELGAILTSAKMDASWMARKIDPEAMTAIRERFNRLVEQLNRGIALKRRIIDNLRPPLLEELGLVSSVQAMLDEVRASTSLAVEFEAPETLPPLSAEKTLALYRITQESVTNVRKYAKARSLTIRLHHADGRLRLEVADDGIGFDPAVSTATHGLEGMRYRVQTFGGRFEVRSAPGAGTRVMAEIAAG